MFNLCVNDLSEKLTLLKIGCNFNSVCHNHLTYVDGTVLIAPSPKALQSMIDTCVKFASDNDLVFNAKEIKCMCIKPNVFSKLYVPKFYLNCNEICKVKSETYLGYIVSDNDKDEESIHKEMRSLYARGNMLISNFKHCTEEVKISLFKTFCSSCYCCPVWSKFKVAALKKIHVAFNKVFKYLMGVRKDFSASTLFVAKGVDNFTILRRKLTYSLFSRPKCSHNQLIENIMHSNFFLKSSICKQWNTVLYLR